MSAITLNLPDDLVERLRAVADRLPRILELGLMQLEASAQGGFGSVSDVMEFLAGLPTPKEILALRPAPVLRDRMSELLEKNRTTGLSATEEEEWRRYEYLEHLVRIAKTKAALKLQTP